MASRRWPATRTQWPRLSVITGSLSLEVVCFAVSWRAWRKRYCGGLHPTFHIAVPRRGTCGNSKDTVTVKSVNLVETPTHCNISRRETRASCTGIGSIAIMERAFALRRGGNSATG